MHSAYFRSAAALLLSACSVGTGAIVDSLQVAVRGMGHSGAAVARFLGVTTSAANRLAASEQLPEVRKFLNAL